MVSKRSSLTPAPLATAHTGVKVDAGGLEYVPLSHPNGSSATQEGPHPICDPQSTNRDRHEGSSIKAAVVSELLTYLEPVLPQ